MRRVAAYSKPLRDRGNSSSKGHVKNETSGMRRKHLNAAPARPLRIELAA